MPPIDLGRFLWEAFVCPFLRLFVHRPKAGDIYGVWYNGKMVGSAKLKYPVYAKYPWGEWMVAYDGIVRPYPYGDWKFIRVGDQP